LQVLEKDGQNIKALYRRAQAYLKRQDFVEAEQDIKAALALNPANSELRKLHQDWKRASAEYAKKEKRIFGNIFEKMAKAEVSKSDAEHS
jgi:FK506-binding protein 4/5